MTKKKAEEESMASTRRTRSRSDAMLLRTRSGRIRMPAPTDSSKKTKIKPQEAAEEDCLDHRGGGFMIKHLRIHRVFSEAPPPPSFHPPPPFKQKIEEEDPHLCDHSSDVHQISPPLSDPIVPPQDHSSDGKHRDAPIESPSLTVQVVPTPEQTTENVQLHSPPRDQTASAAEDRQQGGGDASFPAKDVLLFAADQPRNTPVLAHCSRLKVFSNPSSHCYRRLLPFLLDITKDNSSKLEIVSSRKRKKNENDLSVKPVEKPLPSPPGPVCNDDTVQMQQETVPMQCTQIDDAISEDADDKTQQRGLSEHFSDVTVSELELLCKSQAFSPATSHGDLTVEEFSGVDIKHKLGTGRCHMSDSGPLGSNVTSHVKSILRGPRGVCKGPCTCLDCSSFRLHAERAFEFSKKQMHETEDVTAGLVKELSALRKLVADSVVPLIGKVGNARAQLNQVQVEDICRRSMEAENVARNRLREMKLDLNAHCRIARHIQHKVTFADDREDGGLNS